MLCVLFYEDLFRIPECGSPGISHTLPPLDAIQLQTNPVSIDSSEKVFCVKLSILYIRSFLKDGQYYRKTPNLSRGLNKGCYGGKG